MEKAGNQRENWAKDLRSTKKGVGAQIAITQEKIW